MVVRKRSRRLRSLKGGRKRKSIGKTRSLKGKNKNKRKSSRRLRSSKRSKNVKKRGGAAASGPGNAASPVNLDIGTGRDRPDINDRRTAGQLTNSERHAEIRWIIENGHLVRARVEEDSPFYDRTEEYAHNPIYKKEYKEIEGIVRQEIVRSKELGIKWEPRAVRPNSY